jgi:hypothetical protein
MNRGSKAQSTLEDGSLGGENMTSAVQRISGISLAIPLQFEDRGRSCICYRLQTLAVFF